MEKMQKIRKLKVYEQSQSYNYQRSTIILKGKWLEEYGFKPNDIIKVICEDNKITIINLKDELTLRNELLFIK